MPIRNRREGEPFRAAAENPTEAEVARAKAQIKVSLLMGLESCARRAEQMARHVLAFGRVIPREEIVSAIDAITIDDVRRVGLAMLETPPTITAVGPVKKLLDADRIARHLGSGLGGVATPPSRTKRAS